MPFASPAGLMAVAGKGRVAKMILHFILFFECHNISHVSISMQLNSSVCAAWSEIEFEVHQVFISQKLK